MDGGLNQYLESWAPEPVTEYDDFTPAPAAALAASLDVPGQPPKAGDDLPPLWHWLYFLGWPPGSELGPDGHPRDGHFMPPLPQRRRMIAGGRLTVSTPLRVGLAAERTTTLAGVKVKHGSTGELAFVTLRYEISQAGRPCLAEELDVVYRSGDRRTAMPEPAAGEHPPTDSHWQLSIRPDPTLLFRFSALTANTHRIHYDLPYARDVEGYPALVVHGPLLAILMLELPRRYAPDRPVLSLFYRLHHPVFAGEWLCCAADPQQDSGSSTLWVATARMARHGTAQIAYR